ncbi:MerR family transcriptional regulator [Azomonas macrocytogenes]|uniref:DNA-binding transcriptional MerR regulator n=1 Tax=Azomonas macrocytogenes TaxID=69962 RepID=A0A839T2X2_AZOMA|nr:MerR family transcriptional regulator [Azomonas macrocytogenes]MBB3103349.1 DNA-binding transcriptional MerR regulator [Azomonas macrocytogenes]
MNDPTGPAPPTGSGSPNRQELYPIREVARLTGINPVTLRAWERRYGLIRPTRTESGHRLYSLADIEAIRSIQAWTQRGVPVSKVGDILERSSAGSPGPVGQQSANHEWSEWQVQIRHATSGFDEAALERIYGQVFATWPTHLAFNEILLPVWQDLSRRHHEFGGTSEWLFLDGFLRARVLQRLLLARPQTANRVLLAAVPTHCHELELLVAGLLLTGDSLAVGVLAMGQPLEELGLVCERTRPQGLVLYSNHPGASDLPRQLTRLAMILDCPLALAGEAAELSRDSFAGTPIACLGRVGPGLQNRLQRFLAGQLDT